MRSLLVSAVLVLILSDLPAQVFFDTVMVRPVGPGVTQYHIVAPAVPWSIHVLEMDLKNPDIFLETVKASDRLSSREIVRSMALRKTSIGHSVVGAINGDFYAGDGSPINVQLAQGQLVRGPVGRPALGFDSSNVPMAGIVSLSMSLTLDDTIATVHGVNASRGTDHLILYNSYWGPSTGTNQYGSEALVRPVTGWIANDTVMVVVEALQPGVGNMSIPKGKAVLSGHGASAANVISRLSVDDTVRLYQRLSPALPHLTEMIGGYPKLVVNGNDVSYSSPREPRTAAGFSADSSMLYLIAVDGRQLTLSVGMTFEELAQFMIGIGVYQGMNLDGGGSTTMIVRGEVANSPSDGAERAVSNGLLVISSAPTGSLAGISISPRNARIFRGQTRVFTVFGVDEYGNPSTIDPSQVRYSSSGGVGMIDSTTGVFTAGMQPGGATVYVSYGAMIDSASVYVKTLGSLSLSPRDIVTDTSRTVTLELRVSDTDGLPRAVPAGDIHWSVTDSAVGEVTDGVFKGKQEGRTGVVASLDSLADTVSVSVQIGLGTALLSGFEDLSGWSAAAAFVDSFSVSLVDSVSSEGSGSVRIDYAFQASANDIAYVYLDTDLPIYGLPDSILIDGRTEGSPHRVYYIVEDDNGEPFRVYGSRLFNAQGQFQEVRATVAQAQSTGGGGLFNFPIRLKRVEVQLVYYRQAGTYYTGNLFLDNLRVSYPLKAVTGVRSDDGPLPVDLTIFPNYPNPFNPATGITFRISREQHVVLRVFDLLGREVERLIDSEISPGEHTVRWDASERPTGMYLYRVEARNEHGGSVARSGKMLLVR